MTHPSGGPEMTPKKRHSTVRAALMNRTIETVDPVILALREGFAATALVADVRAIGIEAAKRNDDLVLRPCKACLVPMMNRGSARHREAYHAIHDADFGLE